MAKVTYKLDKAPKGEAIAPLDRVIVSRGEEARFTLREVGEHRLYLAKMVKEAEANAKAQDALAAKVLSQEPTVKDADPAFVRAAHAYLTAVDFAAAHRAKGEEAAAQIEVYDRKMAEIAAAFGPEFDVTEISRRG